MPRTSGIAIGNDRLGLYLIQAHQIKPFASVHANSLPGVVQCGKESNQFSLWRDYCMTYNCELDSRYVGKCPFDRQRAFKIISYCL